MGAAPRWKVYTEAGEYIASCKEAAVAAMIIAGHGTDGMTIRHGHGRAGIVWTEGQEELPAAESFDYVSMTCLSRLWQRWPLARSMMVRRQQDMRG